MREKWGKSADLGLSNSDVGKLVAPIFPQANVIYYDVVVGGLANANIRVHLAGVERPVLVKVYLRGEAAGQKEAAISRLVAGRVPSPRFLYFDNQNPVTGHPYAVIEWMDGERLELSTSPETAARSVGVTLAAIHAIHFDETGFFGTDLTVAEPVDVGFAGLAGFIRFCLVDGRGKTRIESELVFRLLEFIDRQTKEVAPYLGPPCLTHCDFGGSNILVNGAETTAVIDWEFAISGSPFFDFGNLLRPPLGDNLDFVREVERGYRDAGGTLPDDWCRRSMVLDLTAWAEFLNRETVTDGVIATAQLMITRTLDLCGG